MAVASAATSRNLAATSTRRISGTARLRSCFSNHTKTRTLFCCFLRDCCARARSLQAAESNHLTYIYRWSNAGAVAERGITKYFPVFRPSGQLRCAPLFKFALRQGRRVCGFCRSKNPPRRISPKTASCVFGIFAIHGGCRTTFYSRFSS